MLHKIANGTWMLVVPGDVDGPNYYSTERDALDAARATLKMEPSINLYVAQVAWTSRDPEES
jgi:hypothetical protein